MKKTFFALACVAALLFAQSTFAASSPSLDGRAIVAETGTFPRGYFAKTVGYLPGDSISVTNPMNGRQVNIFVIGSLDASEGVAILLSPESAEALDIKKDSNNIVKLTKRNGTADKVANGTAVITNAMQEKNNAEDLKDEIAEAEEIEEEEFDEIPEETEVAFAEEEEFDEIPEETEVAAADEDEFEEIPEETEVAVAEEEEFEEIPEETEVAVAEEEEYDEIPEETEVAAADEDEFDEIPEETEVAVVEEEEEFDEIPEETELAVAEEEEEFDEIPEETEVASAEEEEEFDEILEEKVELAEGILEEDGEDSDEIVYERIDDYYIPEDSEEVAKSSEPLEETEEEAEPEDDTEDVFIAENEAAEDEYDAIVLVPADANPPEPDEDESDNEDTLIAKSESDSTPAEAPSTSLSDKGDARYLKSAADLESQKYYVQIAVYLQNENVEQLDALYGDRYPLTILDEGARKTVLVGPLGMDEYGTVLERFRLFGFRDAFVRHVN